MKATEAIKLLQQRNVNYCVRKGHSDRYSRETDEIIRSFVDLHNKCVKRGRVLEDIKTFADLLKTVPDCAEMVADNILSIIELHKDTEK